MVLLDLLSFLLFSLAIICYYKVILKGPGSPLDFPELIVLDVNTHCNNVNTDEEQSFRALSNLDTSKSPPIYLIERSVQIKSNGSFRFCTKCSCWKPDRCHHCSICNKCQLRMDHHCPWFACCIGYNNHKFFVQFLIYTSLYSTFVLIILGYEICNFFREIKYKENYININLFIISTLALIVSISVGIFTVICLYLVFRNITTIEQYEVIKYRNNISVINDSYYRYSNQVSSTELGNVFDLGYKENWKQIFGNVWKEWFFPIENNFLRANFFDYRGLYYHTNERIYERLRENSKIQCQLLQQLKQFRS